MSGKNTLLKSRQTHPTTTYRSPNEEDQRVDGSGSSLDEKGAVQSLSTPAKMRSQRRRLQCMPFVFVPIVSCLTSKCSYKQGKKGKKVLSAFERRQKEKEKMKRTKELQEVSGLSDRRLHTRCRRISHGSTCVMQQRLTNVRIERKRAERERRLKSAKKKVEANMTNTVFQVILCAVLALGKCDL